MSEIKPKSFWSKPEGKVGAFFLLMILGALGFFIATNVAFLVSLAANTLGLTVIGIVLAGIIYMALDSKARALIGYMYKSVMRWITGLFIKIDPISILKSYVDDLKDNLKKMNRQITQLRGQMHKLKEMILNNQKDIKMNLTQASKAKQSDDRSQVILKTRKSARLKESNIKLEALYKKMEVLYRVLNKMHENSAILVEDVEDQVKVKEAERKAMLAGHSAMQSAMNVIKGDKDKKAMFDAALEAVADDVSQKVGEMERFMEMSESFMQSVDLQNGVFEEKGLRMLEEWESQTESLLLGPAKEELILQANDDSEVLDLNQPIKQPEKVGRTNQYDNFFD